MLTRRDVVTTTAGAVFSALAPNLDENSDDSQRDTDTKDLEGVEKQLEEGQFKEDWTSVENDLQNTGIADSSGQMPTENIKRNMETQEGVANNSKVVADEKNIYVADDWNDRLIAFERQNGDKKWQVGMEGSLNHAPTVAHGKLYGSDSKGNLKALDVNDGALEHEAFVEAISDIVSLNSGYIAAFGAGTGPVAVFDKQLNVQDRYNNSSKGAIAPRAATVNSDGQFVYGGADQNPSSDTFMRMLEFEENDEDIQELRSFKLPNAGPREGAVLVEDFPNVGDVYVYNNNGATVGRRANDDSSFGDQVFSFSNFGGGKLDETSPVPYQDGDDAFVFGGTVDGQFYGVDLESGDGVVFEDWDFRVTELISDEEHLAVGFQGAGQADFPGIKIYDLDDLSAAFNNGKGKENHSTTVPPVADIDEIDTPNMLADGELYGVVDNPTKKNKIKAFDGDSGNLPDVSFSVEMATGVAGDIFKVEPSAINPGMADKFAFTVTDQDGNISYDTKTQSLPNEWDLLTDPDDAVDDVGEFDLILQAINDGNIVDEYSATSSLEALGAGIEGDNSAEVGDEKTYSLIGDPAKLSAIDENTWDLIKNGDMVKSGKGDSFTVKFGDPGDYRVEMDSDVGTRIYSSNLSVTVTEEDPAIKHQVGDVDMDGEIDIVDAVRIQRYLAELDPNPFNQELADVRRSGGVDITDAVLIQQYLAEIRGPRHVSADDLSTDQGSLYADVKNTGGMGARDNAQLTITPQTDEANRIIQGHEPGDPVDLEDLLYGSTVKTEIFDTAPEGGTDLLEYDISDLSDGTYTAVLNTGDDTGKITFTV